MISKRFTHKACKFRRRRAQGGHAVMELALFLPWFLFLFAGSYDAGIYNYALTAMESGARAAAMYTSSGTSSATDATTACTTYVLPQMKYLPNTSTLSSCTSPLTVTATSAKGPDNATASTVTVQYQTPQMVPLPGVLSGQMTITRSVTMRVRS